MSEEIKKEQGFIASVKYHFKTFVQKYFRKNKEVKEEAPKSNEDNLTGKDLASLLDIDPSRGLNLHEANELLNYIEQDDPYNLPEDN